jgi:hypothetical protein
MKTYHENNYTIVIKLPSQLYFTIVDLKMSLMLLKYKYLK